MLRTKNKMRIPGRWMMAWIASMSVLLSACSASRSMETRYEEILLASRNAQGLDDQQLAAALTDRFSTLFRPDLAKNRLGRFSAAELDFAFRASVVTAFYSRRVEHVDAMREILVALEEDGAASSRNYADLHSALIATRQFAEANRLLADHPDMGAAGPLAYADESGGARRTVLKVDPAHDRVTRRPAAPLDEVRVVVVAHPGCGFSRNAVDALEGSSGLGTLILANAQFIAPVDGRIEVGEFQEWNRSHPEATIDIAYRMDEWPEIKDWSTPSFLFFEHGFVVRTVSGWPKGGRWDELKEAAEQIGLRSSPSQPRRCQVLSQFEFP